MKRSIVTHNRSATPGKLGTKAVLLVLFDRRYCRHTVHVLTAACSSVQDLSPPLLLDLNTTKLAEIMSVLGQKALQKEKPQIVQYQNVANLQQKSDLFVPHWKQSGSIPSAFSAVS